MISKLIEIGDRVDIQIYSQVARHALTGEEIRIYKSQVNDFLENGELELMMPIEKGKLMLLALGLRYEFLFYTKSGMYKAVGQVKERYKADNRYMLRIELNTPLSKYQRRRYFRMQCVIEMKYYPITKEQAGLADAGTIMASIREKDISLKPEMAYIVDISGGGVRFTSDINNAPDSYVLLVMRLNDGANEKQCMVVGHVIHCEKLEPGEKHDLKYESRAEFIFHDAQLQEEIIRYIFAEERRARKSDKE